MPAATTDEQIEIVDPDGNPLNRDGSVAYPRVLDMETFLAGSAASASATSPATSTITANTLAAATPNLIAEVQAENPFPASTNRDPTSSFLDGVAHLWSTSKLFDIAVISAVVGGLLFAIFHHSSSNTSTTAKNALTVPVLSSTAAQAARQQVAMNLDAQAQTLRQMGYSDAQIQTPRDTMQFTQDSQISLNSATTSVSKSPTGTLIVTGSNAPNHYVPLHALNNSTFFASLSQNPTADDRLANSAALHGDVVSDSH